jgi:hypothetical protein
VSRDAATRTMTAVGRALAALDLRSRTARQAPLPPAPRQHLRTGRSPVVGAALLCAVQPRLSVGLALHLLGRDPDPDAGALRQAHQGDR